MIMIIIRRPVSDRYKYRKSILKNIKKMGREGDEKMGGRVGDICKRVNGYRLPLLPLLPLFTTLIIIMIVCVRYIRV